MLLQFSKIKNQEHADCHGTKQNSITKKKITDMKCRSIYIVYSDISAFGPKILVGGSDLQIVLRHSVNVAGGNTWTLPAVIDLCLNFVYSGGGDKNIFPLAHWLLLVFQRVTWWNLHYNYVLFKGIGLLKLSV